MRCFNHEDRDAVGICKSCSRGLCHECAVEVGTSLACKDRCADDVRVLNGLIESNIRNAPQSWSFLRASRRSYVLSGCFLVITGVLMVVGGYRLYAVTSEVGFLLPMGVVFAGYGIVSLVRAYKLPTVDRFPPGCCVKCGYDLKGNVSGVCPECGKKMQRS